MHEKEFILELIPTGDRPAGLSFTTAKLLQTRKAFAVEYYLRTLERAFLKEVFKKKKREQIIILTVCVCVCVSYYFSHCIINNINYVAHLFNYVICIIIIINNYHTIIFLIEMQWKVIAFNK